MAWPNRYQVVKLVGVVLFAAFISLVAVADKPPAMGKITLVWAEDQNITTLDPRISQSRHEFQVMNQIFDRLLTFDEDMKPVPWLAKSWEINEDYTAITFWLREGVKFHDGTPLTAEAFKFTFDSIVDPALGSMMAVDMLGPYKQTVVHDDLSFTVEFSRPYAAMLIAFGCGYPPLGPVSPTAIKEKGDAWFAEHPVGTGPFKFVEWVRGSHIILERNEEYNWGPMNLEHQGPPFIERIVIKEIRDASTRAAALWAGEVDVADSIPPIEALQFSRDPDYVLFVGRVSGIPVTMYLNTTRFPTDDLRVRRAICYAINREAIAHHLYYGFVRPAYGPLTETTPCYWPGVKELYPYDPQMAVKLLEEAGWTEVGPDGIRIKDGSRLEIYCPIIFHQELMMAVQGDLRKVGIDLKVDFVTKAKQDELVMNNQYEAGLVRWVAVDPVVLLVLYHSSNIPAPGYFKFNWSRINSPQLDNLLAEAEAALSPSQRCAVYEEIQRLSREMALDVPLIETTQIVVHKKGLTGLRYDVGNHQVLFYTARWEN